jgi:hypothetical protein
MHRSNPRAQRTLDLPVEPKGGSISSSAGKMAGTLDDARSILGSERRRYRETSRGGIAVRDNGWPAKGDKIFGPGDVPVDLRWPMVLGLDQSLIRSFKGTADVTVAAVAAGHAQQSADDLFFAVGYLYRHAVELQLKHILLLGVELHILSELPVEMTTHPLYPLWNQARKVLVEFYGEDKTILGPVESLIQQIHSADPTGQEFRYARTVHGAVSLAEISAEQSLQRMKETIGKLHAFLDSCIGGLSAALDDLLGNMDCH